MKMRNVGLFLGLVLVAGLAEAAPKPAEDLVFKPTFLTGYVSLTGGTGFVAGIDKRQVFITAHHLFGPACGLEKDLTPSEAKAFAAGLAAMSMEHPELILTSSQMLLLPEAKAFDSKDAGHDVAAFLLKDYKGPALTIAATAPKKDDRVYLLARPRGEDKLRLMGCVVIRAEGSDLEYVYDEATVNLAGTSGAPLLNEAGEVVGINLGGGTVKERTLGFANPATLFVPQVATALQAAP